MKTEEGRRKKKGERNSERRKKKEERRKRKKFFLHALLINRCILGDDALFWGKFGRFFPLFFSKARLFITPPFLRDYFPLKFIYCKTVVFVGLFFRQKWLFMERFDVFETILRMSPRV